MLPANSVLKAARHWLGLLQRSDFPAAHALIRAGSDHWNLTYTQYAAAQEWLVSVGLLLEGPAHLEAAPEVSGLGDGDLNRLLFVRGLMFEAPPWLPDADIYVSEPGDLPEDATHLATTLGLDDETAFTAVRQVHGHIDLAERDRVGAAGERALVKLLEEAWPGSVVHIALTNDGFGYDIALNLETAWHLEIKSTTRRGRSIVHLSRHEYEVALIDPAWHLVLVRLDGDENVVSLATISHPSVMTRAPRDIDGSARWDAAKFELWEEDLVPGLVFLDERDKSRVRNDLLLIGEVGPVSSGA